MSVITKSLIFLLLPLISYGQGFSLKGTPPKIKLTCNNVKDIQKGYLLAHILYNKLTPAMEVRTIERYIDYLDGSKILFSQTDIKTIQKKMKGVFRSLEKRDCKKLKDVHALYTKRISERAEFAKSKLSKKFKFNKKTKLILDADFRTRAKDSKALRAIQEKYLHFQVSNYLLTDEKLPGAIKKVKRSYDRVVRKVKELKDEDMLTNYLNAFGHAMDSHSSYFSGDMLEDFEISMRLSLQGIGATLTVDDGFTVVDSLVKGGAAKKSGLVQEKDKIVAVGQYDKKTRKPGPMKEVVEWDLRDVVRLIRGPKGTKVRLKVLRREKGKNKTRIITLVRDKVELEDDAASISYLEKSNNGVKRKIAIINLPSFYADGSRDGRSCAQDVAKLIEDAKKESAQALVLDLSTNGGGSLSDAVDLAGLFFKTGNVVKQSARHPSMKAMSLKDTNPKVNWDKPMVILTSRFSASASEIVAGALKDYNRAVIVGSDHTFGKGTVQQVVPLAPGLGALKVTIGMFFTPGGSSTQHIGVSSHIVLPSENDAVEEEIGEKTLDYSLPPKKIPTFISKNAFVNSGKGKWDKITPGLVGTLKKRSKNRVKNEDKFREILKKVAERKKEPKAIVLEDSFKDQKERKDKREKNKKLSEKAKIAEYLKREDINEAVNVAVDIVDLKNNVPLKVIAQSSKIDLDKNRKVQSEGRKANKPATTN